MDFFVFFYCICTTSPQKLNFFKTLSKVKIFQTILEVPVWMGNTEFFRNIDVADYFVCAPLLLWDLKTQIAEKLILLIYSASDPFVIKLWLCAEGKLRRIKGNTTFRWIFEQDEHVLFLYFEMLFTWTILPPSGLEWVLQGSTCGQEKCKNGEKISV